MPRKKLLNYEQYMLVMVMNFNDKTQLYKSLSRSHCSLEFLRAPKGSLRLQGCPRLPIDTQGPAGFLRFPQFYLDMIEAGFFTPSSVLQALITYKGVQSRLFYPELWLTVLRLMGPDHD